MKKKKYGEFIRAFSRKFREEDWEAREEAWERFRKEGDIWAMSWLGHLASMHAALYREEGRREDLETVRRIGRFLCEKAEKAAENTAALNGSAGDKMAPVMETIFSFTPFMKALWILGRETFEESEWAEYETLCFTHAAIIFTDCEWGRHNRCALRAVTLLLFAKLFPGHSRAKEALELSGWLIQDSLGNWSIEDAASYQGIWLTCIAEYVQYAGVWDFRIEQILSWYSHYFAAMLLPSGGIPEFGDTRFDSATSSMLVLGTMELIASRHRDGELKFAIEKQFYNMVKNSTMDNQAQMERGLTDAYLWADDGVEPREPAAASMEVLEEAIGKKAVFRSDWSEKGIYLFYNYKDVGCLGRQTIDYLQRTIPVHAEKPHHGHADEQSINALCAGGAVFLRDGGYRDAFTTNGHYRADFYHNRMILRKGRLLWEKGFLEFAENIGDYIEVSTQKLYFRQFSFAQTIRTRLYDPEREAVCDRQIIYLPLEKLFVVADTLQSQKKQPLTAGVLYHAKTVRRLEENLFRIPEDDYEGLTHFHDRPLPERKHQEQSMLIAFAPVSGGESVSLETERRNYRQETALSWYQSRYFAQNESCSMVSLLIPELGASEEELCEARRRSETIAKTLRAAQTKNGANLTVRFRANGQDWTIGIECDRERRVADYNRRPAYDYENGKCRYGDYETDASFFISNGKRFGALDVIQVKKQGSALFEARPFSYNQLDFVHVLQAQSSWCCYEGEE